MSNSSVIDSFLTCSYIHTPLSTPIKYQEVKINTYYFPFNSTSILVKAIHNAIQTRIEINFLSMDNMDQFAPIVINIPGGTVSNFIVYEDTSQTSFRLWAVGRLNGLIRFNFKPDILEPKQIIYNGLKLFEDRKLDDVDFSMHIELIEMNRMLLVPKHCLTPTIIDIMSGPSRELSVYKTLEIPKYVGFSFFPGLMSFTGSSVEVETPKHNITSILQLPNGNKALFWLRDYKRIHIWDLQTYSESFSKSFDIAINHVKDTNEYKDLDLNQLRVHSIHSFIDNWDQSTFYLLIAYENADSPLINIFRGRIDDSGSLDQNYWECVHLVKWANWDSETNSTSIIQDIHLVHETTISPIDIQDEGSSSNSNNAHLLKIWILIERMSSPFVFSIDIPLDQCDLTDEYESRTLLSFSNPTVYFEDCLTNELEYSFDMNLSPLVLMENFIDKLFRPFQFSFSTLIAAIHQYIDIINGKEESTESEKFFIDFMKSKLANSISLSYDKDLVTDTQDITYQIEIFISICKNLESYIKSPRKIIRFKEMENQMALVGVEYIGLIRASHQIEYINTIIFYEIDSSAIFKICSNSSNAENILLQGPCKQKGLYSFIETLADFNRFIKFESGYFDVEVKPFESNLDESHFSLTEVYSSKAFYSSYIHQFISDDTDFQSTIGQLAHKIRNNLVSIQSLIDLIDIFKQTNTQLDTETELSNLQYKPNPSSISFETLFLSNTSYQMVNSGFEVANLLLWLLINCKACISNQLLDSYILQCIDIHIKYTRLYQLLSYPTQKFSIGSTSSLTTEFVFPYTTGPQEPEYYQTISNFVPTTIPSILDGFINLFDFKNQPSTSPFNSDFLTTRANEILSNLDFTKILTMQKTPTMALILLQWLCYHHKSPRHTLKFLSTLKPHPIIFYFMGALEAKVYGDSLKFVQSFQKASICDVKQFKTWEDNHPLQQVIPIEYFERGASGYYFFLANHFKNIGYCKLASEFYRRSLYEFDLTVMDLLQEASNNTSPRAQSQSKDLSKSQDNTTGLRISQNIIQSDGSSIEFNRNEFIYLLVSCYIKLKKYKSSIDYLKELNHPRRKAQLIYDLVFSLHKDDNLMKINSMILEDLEWDFIQAISQIYQLKSLSIQQRTKILNFLQNWYLKKNDWGLTISALIDQIIISINYAKNTLGISIIELKSHVKLWKKVIRYFKRLPKGTPIEVNYFFNADNNGWRSEPRKLLFTIFDAIKQHQKSVHRLKLANMSHIALDPLKLNSCQEFVNVLVENNMLYRALDFSIYHQLDLTPILQNLTVQVIRNPAFPPNRFLSPDPSYFFKAIFEILERSYLPRICYFKEPPKYEIAVKHYASVIETLIASNHHQSIPPRLSSYVRNTDFNLLLTIYCKYEITKEVGDLAILYLESIPLPKPQDLFNRNKKLPLPLETILYVISSLKSTNMTIGIGEELERVLNNHLDQLKGLEANFKKLALN
jgi:hypothetical protein